MPYLALLLSHTHSTAVVTDPKSPDFDFVKFLESQSTAKPAKH